MGIEVVLTERSGKVRDVGENEATAVPAVPVTLTVVVC
jgi:hypothetical protein